MAVYTLFELIIVQEAFCRWDDEKTGLNPFLPQYPSTKGFGNFFKRYILGTILFCVRLPFFLLTWFVLFISQFFHIFVFIYPSYLFIDGW